MGKPGGTGRPRLGISASPEPLPPRRLPMDAFPSARPSPKLKTHLPLAGEADFDADFSTDFDTDFDLAAFFGLGREAFRVTIFLRFMRTRGCFRLAMAQATSGGERPPQKTFRAGQRKPEFTSANKSNTQ